MAISTYSALFNYNPRFTAPQALILDDAHAAENYVAGHWTVTIDRHSMQDAYHALAGLLRPVMDSRMAGLMTEKEPSSLDRTAVEQIPLPRWWPLADAMRETLEEAVKETDEWYAWEDHVRDGLSGCCMLVSWGQIVLRPLVPTTANHPQFAESVQRVYMSATLGAGGELERIFGVRHIERLPVPEEWEQHSTGRRLFLLPAASLRSDALDEVVVDAIEAAGRALVLVPTRSDVDEYREALDLAGVPTLGAGDIEESLEPFTSQERAALVLANRYDGIDLPANDCRLVVLAGLPVGVNLLERFLNQRLNATTVLGERMRTRLTQGVGRATRGEGDWCAVLVSSREAHDFCARGEVRALLHPELQAELRFGLEQSHDRQAQDFLDLLGVLLEHGQEWQEADEQIRRLRDEAHPGTDPAAAVLEGAVSDEIDFTYAMRDGNFPHALERAVAVADALAGDEVAAYRAWWLYQAGAAAWMAHHNFAMAEMLPRSRELFSRAAAAGRNVHWFAELAYGELGEDDGRPETPPRDLQAVERALARLRSIGFHGRGLARRATALRQQLEATESTPWELGLTRLGELLGFDASHPSGNNTPDSVWVASRDLAIVWEVKSEESQDGEVGARTVQQAAGHEAWVRAHCSLDDDAEVLAILASDRMRLGDGAEIHAGDVCLVDLDEVRGIAEQALAALTRVRALGQGDDEAALRSKALEELGQGELLPSQLVSRLAARPLAELA